MSLRCVLFWHHWTDWVTFYDECFRLNGKPALSVVSKFRVCKGCRKIQVRTDVLDLRPQVSVISRWRRFLRLRRWRATRPVHLPPLVPVGQGETIAGWAERVMREVVHD